MTDPTESFNQGTRLAPAPLKCAGPSAGLARRMWQSSPTRPPKQLARHRFNWPPARSASGPIAVGLRQPDGGRDAGLAAISARASNAPRPRSGLVRPPPRLRNTSLPIASGGRTRAGWRRAVSWSRHRRCGAGRCAHARAARLRGRGRFVRRERCSNPCAVQPQPKPLGQTDTHTHAHTNTRTRTYKT
jgi:hypothetical protein